MRAIRSRLPVALAAAVVASVVLCALDLWSVWIAAHPGPPRRTLVLVGLVRAGARIGVQALLLAGLVELAARASSRRAAALYFAAAMVGARIALVAVYLGARSRWLDLDAPAIVGVEDVLRAAHPVAATAAVLALIVAGGRARCARALAVPLLAVTAFAAPWPLLAEWLAGGWQGGVIVAAARLLMIVLVAAIVAGPVDAPAPADDEAVRQRAPLAALAAWSAVRAIVAVAGGAIALLVAASDGQQLARDLAWGAWLLVLVATGGVVVAAARLSRATTALAAQLALALALLLLTVGIYAHAYALLSSNGLVVYELERDTLRAAAAPWLSSVCLTAGVLLVSVSVARFAPPGSARARVLAGALLVGVATLPALAFATVDIDMSDVDVARRALYAVLLLAPGQLLFASGCRRLAASPASDRDALPTAIARARD